MSISIIKTERNANAITHPGVFHADDVVAAVIVAKYFELFIGNVRFGSHFLV